MGAGVEVGVDPAPVVVPPFDPQAAKVKASMRASGTMNKNDCRRMI